MALARRIIPCLDVKGGRTVKGTRFRGLRDCGGIAELSAHYALQGADELVFLDIAASGEKRGTRTEWVEEVARNIAIPFTVGGGVASERDVERLLRSGADKISVNTAALRDPSLVTRLAEAFGRQCVVVAIDARPRGGRWEVYFSDPMQCQDEVQIAVNGKRGTHALPQGKNRGTTLRFEID